MKPVSKIIIVGAVLLVGWSMVYGQMPDLTSYAKGCMANFFNNQPPVIWSVKTEPAEPVADELTMVIAEIANDVERTDDETISAKLHYSVDGGKTWEEVEMEQDEDDPKIWRAEIPGQPSGTEVVYFLSATDTSENVASEVPGISSGWLPEEEGSILLSAPAIDEECSDSPVDLDIRELALGYDKDYFYSRLTVSGEISGGKVSPPYGHIYLAAALNLDTGEDIDFAAIASGAQKGFAVVYGELIPDLGGSALGWGKVNAVDARVASTNQPIPESECGVAAYKDGPHLYVRIKRSVIGNNPTGRILVVAASVALTSTDPTALMGGSGFEPKDLAPFLRIYLRNHSYKVP